MNEKFKWILGLKIKSSYYGLIVGFTEGTTNKVSSCWKLAYSLRRTLIGFYHTHPGKSNRQSTTDINTMNVWTLATGKPLVAIIEAAGKQNVCLVSKKHWKNVDFMLLWPFIKVNGRGHKDAHKRYRQLAGVSK